MSAGTFVVGATELRIPWTALRVLAAAAGLLAFAVMAVQAIPYVDRPVIRIRIDGHFAHLTPAQIAVAAGLQPGVKLFAVDLAQLRAQVEALPWVAHARATRVWPEGVALRVDEREPVARWRNAGLLDTELRTFTPPARDLPQGLPLLAGPEDRVADVWSAYQKLAAALSDGPLAVDSLSLDARGEWTAQTRGGVVLRLGQDDPVLQITLLTGTVVHSLADKFDQVAYIDLRYPNGFAVGWRSGEITTTTHAARVAGGKR
jgi:cell division protein FtsQ